jgi:formate hydrogenlyase subunit 3/multisubunit Na+/H+ antiporter MnhD subunit
MNKTIKIILLVVGVALIAYGIYTYIQPETEVSIADVNLVKAQDNTNAFIMIGIGIVAVIASLFEKTK